MADFYCIPTSLGLIKLASAANGGTPVQIVEFAVGDANGEPYLPQTRVNAIALIHEQYRALLESVTVSPSDASVYIAKIKIPANVGGFYLCEIALIDTDGDIIYLANYPYNYKPTLTQGAGGELVIPVYLQSSAADTITIIQNPNVITLSQAEGDARYALINGNSNQPFKVSNATHLDEAVSLEQLYKQKSGYFNTPILTLTNGQTGLMTLPPQTIVRILLVGGGAGGGQVNENFSGVNDYSSSPNQGLAENGTHSSITLVGIGEIARAEGGLAGKSGMRDIGEDAGRYTGYAGNHGHAALNVGYAMLLGAARPSDVSPKRVHQDHPYPYYAYTINGVPLGNYGLGGDGAYGSFSPNDPSGAGGPGGNGAILECLIKNSTDNNMTLELTAGQLGQGYYYDAYGNNYAGAHGQAGLIVVYA
ncbi:phage tail protein [Agitococcus lubricus]|uniref:Tail-collar fiber protein n=1 Tax=Agitococcus lubricus TaxID=1077255 RepID=A0A2T5J1H4_9GAMM|nr:phage tail protein [Agitococcus lubricus]PTQ90277.1 tail-collar fiber protein [Agitococcus lubricus]